MAKLLRQIFETTIRWEETEELTPEQIERWKTEDESTQCEVMEELEFELMRDKTIDDYHWPKLIGEE